MIKMSLLFKNRERERENITKQNKIYLLYHIILMRKN